MTAISPSGSHNHHARLISADTWQIYWTVDQKYGRMLYPRTFCRSTDDKGAKRFIKKWGLKQRLESRGVVYS